MINPKQTNSLAVTLAVAALALVAVSQATAQTTFISDSFDRADNLNLDASTNGMSGVLIDTGTLVPDSIWLEPDDVAYNNDNDSQVIGNQVQMGGHGHSVHIIMNKNFDTVLSNGTVSVSLDLVNSPGGPTPLQRYYGIAAGFNLDEGNVSQDRILTRVAALYVAETENGQIRINDEDPTLRGTGDVIPTTTISTGSTSFVPGTLRVDMTITNTAVGSTVVYDVFFNGTDMLPGTRSFVINDAGQFYVGVEERSGSAVNIDNFSISASSYTPPPLSALTWRALTDNVWDTSTVNWVDSGLGNTTHSFFSGADVTFGDNTASTSVSVPSAVTPGNMIVNNANSDYSFTGAGSIQGAGSLSKYGAGMVTMGLNNTYSGGTMVGAGRIRVGNDNALGSGLITFNGGDISSDSTSARTLANPVKISIATGFGDATDNGPLTFNGMVDFDGNQRTVTVNSDTVFAGGATNGAIGSKQGTGTLTVKGNVEYTGTADVQDGTLVYDGATMHCTGRVIANAGGVGGIARLVITNGANITVSNTVGNLRAGLVASTGSNYVDLAGQYNLPNSDNNNGYLTLEGDAAYSQVTFWPGGDFTARGITNNAGSANTVFNFNGGILRARNDNPNFFEGIGSTYVQAGGAIIDDGGFNIAIRQDLLDGGGGLTKLGAGTLALNGYNYYTGDTVVSNGTLIVSASSLLGGGNVMVADNATFSVTNDGGSLSVPSLTLGSSGGSALQFNFPYGNAYSATVIAGNLTANGSVAVNITGTGLTAGQFPLIQFTTASGLPNFHIGTLPPGVSANLVQTANTIELNITSVVKSLEWVGTTDSNWDTATLNWYDLNNGYATTNYAQSGGFGDMVTFDYYAPGTISLALDVTPVSLTVNGSSYGFTGPGKISGAGHVAVNNFSTLTMGTENDYSGGTILNSGYIYVGANQALGSGPVTINQNSVLASASSSAYTLTNTFIQTADIGVSLGDSTQNGALTLGVLDLDGGMSRTLAVYSPIILSDALTNGAFSIKTGAGSLTIRGDSTQHALVNQNEGDVVIDGARFDNGDGWRLQNDTPATTIHLVVTNGGTFTINTPSANLRVGLGGGDNASDNILDVAGTVDMTPSPALSGNSAVMLGGSGANDVMNLLAGGNVIARAISGRSPGNTEVHFDGGTLTALGDETAFIAGLTNAFMENGGVTIDTVDHAVTIPQALLASGSGGLTKVGTGTLALTGADTYSGPTLVNAGKLVLGPAFASAGSITVAGDATLAFQQDTMVDTVNVSAVAIGSGANAALEADLAGVGTPAGYIANLTLNGVVAVNVTGPLALGEFPLFGYGTISGAGSLTLGQIPQGTVASLKTNTTAQTIDLVVSSKTPTVWTGATNGDWDLGTTNWTSDGVPVAFAQFASALFDDSASNSTVNVATSVKPSELIVSNSDLSYVFDGSGSIDGNVTLQKFGTNSLALNSGNTFSGTVTIHAGELVAGINTTLGSSANPVYVTNGGTFRMNLQAMNGAGFGLQPFIVSGSGVNGEGAFVNDGVDQNNATRNLTLAGDTVVGGIGTIGVRTSADSDPGLVGNGYKLTKIGAGALNINGGQNQSGLTNVWSTDIGDIDVKEGTLSFERRTALGRTTNTITVEAGAILQLFSLDQSLPVPENKIVMTNAALNGTGFTGDMNTLASEITVNGTNNTIGSVQFLGEALTALNINGPVVGSGAVNYTGPVILAGTNTYTGDTRVVSGTLSLAYSGRIDGSANIYVESAAALDVSAAGSWTLGASQTLAGSGAVNGSVQANGTVSPGDSIGTLTFSNDLVLAGDCVMELNRDSGLTNDMVSVAGALSYGGQLDVILTGSTPLQAGDTFKLFDFVSAPTGNFTLNLPAGYTWDTSQLAVNGTISVTGVASTPQISSLTVAGGSLVLTGSGGSSGGQYYILSSTNVALPLSNWEPVVTNNFGTDGGFTNTLPVSAGEPNRFYILQLP